MEALEALALLVLFHLRLLSLSLAFLSNPPPPPGTITKLYRYLFSSTVPSPILPVPLKVCFSLFPCGTVVHFQSTPSTYPVLVTVVAIDRADPDQLLYTVRRSDGLLIDTDSRSLHDIPNHPVVFVVNTAVLYSKHFSTPLITQITLSALPMINSFTPFLNTSVLT